jgi:hypothetical protein
MISQNLKTVVTLGGAVDTSFSKVTSSFNKTMGEANKTVRDLEVEQRRLTSSIKQTEKAQEQLAKVESDQAAASASLARLNADRQEVTRTINTQRLALRRLESEQAGAADAEGADLSEINAKRSKLEKTLNDEIVKRDKLTGEIKQTTKAQKDYVAKAGRIKESIQDVDELKSGYNKLEHEIAGAKKQQEGFNKASSVGKTLKTVAVTGAAATAAIWGTGAALTGFMTITNVATTKTVGLAKSYDMTIERFQAWSGVAKQAGLDGEHVGDLIEELSNKFGEFKSLGKQSAVSDVFGALGVDASMMEGLSAAEQFEFIMKRIEKVQDKQQAASLADQLFGGEANKIVTYTRNTGKSIDELLSKQDQLNLLTAQGAQGATDYGSSFNRLTTVMGSAWAEISGIVGGEMAGDIDNLGTQVAAFVRENKREIVGTIKSIVYATKDAAMAVYQFGSSVNSVAQALGGWSTIGAVVAGLVAGKMVVGVGSFVTTAFSMVKALGAAKSVMMGLNVVMAANPFGVVALAVGAVVTAGILLYQNWDTVKGWFSSTFDWFGEKFSWFGGVAKKAFSFSPLGMVVNNWEPITGFFSGMWDGITKLFDDRIAKIKTVVSSVTGWVKRLKFWGDDGDSSVRVVASSSARPSPVPVDSQQRVGRGAVAMQNAAPAGRPLAITQQVGDIHVIAAPGQNPQDVAQTLQDRLSGHRNSALYDLPQFN